MDDDAPRESERSRLLGHISVSLDVMNEAELRNLWRMVELQALSPKNAHSNHNLGYYPCREVANTLEQILPVCFRDQWVALQREMPLLLHASTEDFTRILRMCSNTTLVPVDTLEERLRSFTDRDKGSDDTEKVSLASWELYGEYCKLSALVTFNEMLATFDEPTGSQDIAVFSTECKERASGILFDQATCLIHADHADWVRMKASQSLRVQGSLVNGDVLVSEVMYDTACRLGMPLDGDVKAQVTWLEERADMWVWVTKLIRQGCWAPLMFIVGTALYGADFTWQLTAAMTTEDGHKLDIDVTQEEGGAYKLSIVASARFAVRDSTPDMNVIGKIPVQLIVTFMVDQQGTTTGFNMATTLRLSKKVFGPKPRPKPEPKPH